MDELEVRRLDMDRYAHTPSYLLLYYFILLTHVSHVFIHLFMYHFRYFREYNALMAKSNPDSARVMHVSIHKNINIYL